MKKVLFSVFGVAMTIALFAQTTVGYTTYDLQTNNSNCRRIIMNAAGEIAVTYTKSHTNDQAASDRGVGYNYWDGSTWSAGEDFSNPGSFVRPGLGRNGWPNINLLDNGTEVVISHFAGGSEEGLQVLTRPLGSGAWTTAALDSFPDATWSRVANSGDSIIAIMSALDADVAGFPAGLAMQRSFDGGATWTGLEALPFINTTNFPYQTLGDGSISDNLIGGDVYSIDANDDGTVAIVVGGLNVFVFKSSDFGDTWTTTRIVESKDENGTPNPGYTASSGETLDTLRSSDESFSIVVDDDGDVHVWYGLISYFKDIDPSDPNATGTSYFPLQNNLQYWNETLSEPVAILETEIRPEQIGNCESLLSTSIFDPTNPTDPFGIQHNLYFGRLVSQPSGAYDASGNLYVVYSAMRAGQGTDENNLTNVNDGQLHYKDIFMITSSDNGATWNGPINISNNDLLEDAYPTIPRKIYGTDVPVIWQQDAEPGNALSTAGTNSNSLDGYVVPFGDNYIMYDEIDVSAGVDEVEPTYSWLGLDGLDEIDVLISPAYTDAGLDLPADASCWAFIDTVDNVMPTVQGTYTYVYTVEKLDLGLVFDVTRTVNVIPTDNTAPVITISGNVVDTLEACESYVDMGATAFDNIDGDVTANIVVTGSIDPTVLGSQTITYTVTDASPAMNTGTATRTVIVEDTQPPTITLTGTHTDNKYYHHIMTPFVAPTPIYEDCITDPVTNTSVNAGGVNSNIEGPYTVVYEATDDAMNFNSIGMQVVVGREPVFQEGGFTFNQTANPREYAFFSTAQQILYSPTDWTWDFGDENATSTDVSPTYQFSAAGTYEVCAYASNAFNIIENLDIDSACNTINIGVGILDRNELDAVINVFPNPSTGLINIEIEDVRVDDLTITITNVVGAEIATKTVNVNGSIKVEFNLENNPAGIYFVNISSETAASTQKVVLK